MLFVNPKDRFSCIEAHTINEGLLKQEAQHIQIQQVLFLEKTDVPTTHTISLKLWCDPKFKDNHGKILMYLRVKCLNIWGKCHTH